MRKLSILISCMLAAVLLFTACGSQSAPAATTAAAQTEEATSQADISETESESEESEPETEEETEAPAELDPAFDLANYADKWVYVTQMPKTERGEIVYAEDGSVVYQDVQPCYVLTDIPYCLNPADPDVQLMDIYVPAEYMDGTDNGDDTFTCTIDPQGTFTREDSVSYTALNAPVILQNTIDGYAQGERLMLTSGRKGQGVGTYNNYLESGYVLLSVGSRGIGSESDGTAPACVTDLKAGIRLAKANDEVLPGDMNKIIATGTSAGGGVTSVLGSSGNSPEYDPYLEEIGAIMDSTDDVYCAMAFCPITNLDSADAAYEWLHSSETSTKAGGMMMGGGPGGPMMGGGAGGPGGDMMGGGQESEPTPFDEFELAMHDALIESYENTLKDFGIDPDEMYQGLLDAINECVTYYAENYDGEQYTVEDAYAFIAENMSRIKGVPSFDGFDASNKENQLFDNEHFSTLMADVLDSLAAQFPEAAEKASAYRDQITDERVKEVELMTPNYFITGSDSDIAPFWRFRIGTKDGDLGAVSALTMKYLLELNTDSEVDYALIWGVGHMSADYSYDDVQAYVDSICK